jgi:two-component system LytT family response regulator
MYKAILIDDEPLARELVRTLLKPWPQITVVDESGDGFEGFKSIQEHQPDLIFLDVQMPRLSGFEMLELLDPCPSVIFITAFDEYALKAFEAHAVDYLMKPVTKSRFEQALQKWLMQAGRERMGLEALLQVSAAEGYRDRIVVKDNGMIRIIPARDIHYIEASDDYIRIVTAEGRFLKKATLSHVAQTLDPQQFVRVHRSFLIPVSQLLRIEPYEKESHIALLQCGAKVTVSKNGLARLKTLLGW